VNLWHSEPTPEAQIAADPLRRELSRALAALGHEILVVQEHRVAAELVHGPVRWRFVRPSNAARLGRALLAGRPDAIPKAPAPHVAGPVLAWRPDVIHSFDLAAYPTLAILGGVARATGARLVAHDHGGAPARTAALRAIQRVALARTDALLSTTLERGERWPGARVFEVFESSSVLTPGDRAAARHRTGLTGDPVCLHVGRLDDVKDPLTTIRGFRELARRRPGARLYLAWTDAPLLPEVRAAAEGLPVVFLGRQPRSAMEDLYRSADLLLQASRREVCGYAILESLATGTPPVLSDIPPFRRLTDGGRVGRLFAPGDPAALAAAAIDAWGAVKRGELGPDAVRRWFDAELAFPVLARRVDEVYRQVTEVRR
jgi:glycosyltransferase involved in cell wall biosynthesis